MGVVIQTLLAGAVWLATSEAVLEPKCSPNSYSDGVMEKMIRMDVKMEQVLQELKGIDDIRKFQNSTEEIVKQMTNMREVMVQTEERMDNMSKGLGQLEQKIQDLVKLANVNCSASEDKDDKGPDGKEDDKGPDGKDEVIDKSQSSMGKPCTSNNTCTDVDGAECRDKECKCLPGLSYRNSSRLCVEDCGDDSQYVDTYQHVKGMALWGFYTHKTTDSTAEKCMEQCTKITEINCRMAEYKPSSGMCQVSWETLASNPSDAKEKPGEYDVYVRNCV